MVEPDKARLSGMQLGFGLGGAKPGTAQPEVAYRVLVVGDFGGPKSEGAQGLTLRNEVPADLPQQFGAAATFSVPNLLGSAPDPLPISVPIRRLSDFSVRALNAAVEPLRRAMSLRTALAGGLRGFENYPDLDRLAAEIGPAPAPTPPSQKAGSEVDRLLSMLDLGGGEPEAPPAGRPHGRSLRDAIAAADHLIGRQLALVREHRHLAALEATWRGLMLLTGPQGLPPAVQIDLVDVAADQAATCLIRDIVPDELEQNDRARAGCIVLLGAVPGTADGLHQLAFCAAAGAALQVPVIVSLAQDFFDAQETTLQAGWQLLREDDSAAWLAVCLGDIVLGAEGRDQPLWGEPGWAVATLVVQSIARFGWASELANPSAIALEGLDVHEITGRGGPAAWPLRRPLARSEAADLAAAGVLSPAAQANRDRVFLAAAPCLAPGVDLPDQLLVAQLLAQLSAAWHGMGHLSDAEGEVATRRILDRVLAGFGTVMDVRAGARTPGGGSDFRIAVRTAAAGRTIAFRFSG